MMIRANIKYIIKMGAGGSHAVEALPAAMVVMAVGCLVVCAVGVEKMVGQVERVAREAKEQELCNILWSLAVAGRMRENERG